MFAFCYASGQIGFGTAIPQGALPIAKGDDDRKLRDWIEGVCRHSYDGKTLLVPGIPEAPNQSKALDALKRFTGWLNKSVPQGVETIESKHRARAGVSRK